ncbi:MAG: sulfotransferase domain-containing protein [Chloroflexota bacterium]|nr:sulfotransferase domain-containing protein [Chloroflexota bacterium]
MRILIAAPPKAGNSWLKCLLATIYDLDWLTGDETPQGREGADFGNWVAAGGFRDGSIFHHHYDYSAAFVQEVAAVPAHLVSIIRDPYDSFVSLFYFVQVQAASQRNSKKAKLLEKRANPIVGKPIDSPEAMAYLATDFRNVLQRADGWLNASEVAVVRYEELHRDPVTELRKITDQIEPVSTDRIERAVRTCEANTLRQTRPGLQKRIRSATVGDWRNHLTEEHLAIFRAEYADLVERLGYEVQ